MCSSDLELRFRFVDENGEREKRGTGQVSRGASERTGRTRGPLVLQGAGRAGGQGGMGGRGHGMAPVTAMEATVRKKEKGRIVHTPLADS